VQRTVFGGPLPPFGSSTVEVIAAFADGTVDISDPGTWLRSPEAIQAILAEREGGWANVRGPGPLTWHEAKLSLQLLAEERVGWLQRERAYAARAHEDAAWAQMAGAVPKP
jgi:hypothetical protein